ncbi:Life-span regulatory factor domain-containing protein [Madurella fahalii]|uniref:Life-span regulatory factor domain-containing protein n=1 Tax=Madurella fahalii TaxID=1157608 RepID=A0ABQ0G6F4_9PEZI
MSLEWTHEFCLSCDKQTDGATYCSESCRLADYEKTSSSPSSTASSPTLSEAPYDWAFSKPTTTSTKFYLSPAYDFGLASPSTRRDSTRPALSPSTSHSSLCSMRSNSSAGLDAAQLSEKAARELRAYARSFESVRLQRRRSY